MAERPDELAADLFETYGLDIEAAMGGAHGPSLVAALAVQLPQSCRWRVAYDEDNWWTQDRQLVARLVNDLESLIYGMSDKKKRGNRPRPIGPSWVTGTRRRSARALSMTKDRLLRELSKKRKAREVE